jgi:DNA-binding SARP family transcriptional activator
MIACRLLGPVEVSVDSGPAPPELLWRKHLALLVYLALSPRRARSREHIVGLLWGDRQEAQARHSLREAIRILRHCVGEAAVDADATQVRLVGDVVTLDTDEFEQHAAAGQWPEAAALVAGDFMEGFAVPDASPFEDWLAAERIAWRRRAADALRRAAESDLRVGRVREALGAARRALALEPLSDLAVRTVMQGEALAGDRAAALETFTTFAERVKRETGAEPEPGTSELAERIRRARTPRRPRPTPAEPQDFWSRRAPLTGRVVALGDLASLSERVGQGPRAGVALIEGDMGMGKTRLAEELTGRLGLAGWTTASALAVRADAADPSSGLVGLARGGLLDAPGVGAAPVAALAAFAQRIPAWGDRFPAARAAEAQPVARAFREIVGAAAEERPVLLATDDAHCLDDESLLAIQAVLRDIARGRVLVVLAVVPGSRRTVVDELRAEVGRTLDGVTVALERLTRSDIAGLVTWAFPHYAPDAADRLARRIVIDSAGVPLLVVELLHAIVRGLEPADAGGAWPAPFRTLDQTLPGGLPDAVVGAIRVGFRGLSRGAQTVLAAVSVLPDRVSEDLVRRVTGLSAEDASSALDELEWQRWVLAESRGYTFVARIVKDVIARDMLTPGQKRRVLEAADLTSP